MMRRAHRSLAGSGAALALSLGVAVGLMRPGGGALDVVDASAAAPVQSRVTPDEYAYASGYPAGADPTRELHSDAPSDAARLLSDPAMEAPVAETRVAVRELTPTDPESSVVDLDAERVFLRGKGWLDADAFWRLYYERPDELPSDLDHEALHDLPRPSHTDISG